MQADIPMLKKVGETFVDHQFRRWKVFNIIGEIFYDCEFVEYLNGFIKDTPRCKLFSFDNELFVQEAIQTDIEKYRSRPIDPQKILEARELLDSLEQNH